MRLLVAEKCPPLRLRILFQAQETTRLGEGVSRTGQIGKEAAERTLALLLRYREIIQGFRPDALEVVGTETLRAATNAEQFLRLVEESAGWRIRILSPAEEAYFALIGLRYGSPDLPEKLILLDLGGASTELARSAGFKMKELISLPLGAVGIYEEFVHTDPPAPSDLEGMLLSLGRRLEEPLRPLQPWQDHLLVGTAGTITTLGAIHLGLKEYDGEQVSRVSLAQHQIRQIFDHLCRLPLSRRAQVPGLEAKRADIILSGTAILLVILKLLRRDRLRVCDGGLREGILLHLMGKGD
ncbi:MAG: hypothetical protein QHH30_01575 [candidate division NC10 bacterium]|nr:hypothetical protein [candidate division NC10 bacterium]